MEAVRIQIFGKFRGEEAEEWSRVDFSFQVGDMNKAIGAVVADFVDACCAGASAAKGGPQGVGGVVEGYLWVVEG